MEPYLGAACSAVLLRSCTCRHAQKTRLHASFVVQQGSQGVHCKCFKQSSMTCTLQARSKTRAACVRPQLPATATARTAPRRHALQIGSATVHPVHASSRQVTAIIAAVPLPRTLSFYCHHNAPPAMCSAVHRLGRAALPAKRATPCVPALSTRAGHLVGVNNA